MPHVYLGGHAARSEEYMRTHWAAAKGFTTSEGLEKAARNEELRWQQVQANAGLTWSSPACVRWEDLLRILCRAGTTVTAGSLTRTFATNTFHRQPVVEGPVEPLDADVLQTLSPRPVGPWVLTLPGPWDFAARSKSRMSREAVALQAGSALAPLVDAALAQGACLVRFHEPSALYPQQAAPPPDVFAEALVRAGGRHRRECTLHLTNGSLAARTALAEANPLGGLSIEPLDRPLGIALPNGTRLSVAALEGQESLVESPSDLLDAARRTADHLGLGLWGITNGWDLDHVPHGIAVRKVQALGQAGRLREVPA